MKEYIIKVNENDLTPSEKACLKDYHPVDLVRCKDCKHWDADEHDCNIKIGWFACGADWFCADGERK